MLLVESKRHIKPVVFEGRPPAFVVVRSFDAARRVLQDYSIREIGGVCVKGGGVSDIGDIEKNEELMEFMTEVASATKGRNIGRVGLRFRRNHRKVVGQGETEAIRFTAAKGKMHYDGIGKPQRVPGSKKLSTVKRRPIQHAENYLGAGHHITTSGTTDFYIHRLTASQRSGIEMTRDPISGEITDSKMPIIGMQGQYCTLEEGDYLTLHANPVIDGAIYMHGSTNSSNDRVSQRLSPVEFVENAQDYLLIAA